MHYKSNNIPAFPLIHFYSLTYPLIFSFPHLLISSLANCPVLIHIHVIFHLFQSLISDSHIPSLLNIYSLIQSFIHYILPFTHLLFHSFTHSPVPAFTQSFAYSLILSTFIHSLSSISLLFYTFTHSSHSYFRLFVHLLIYSFSYSSIHSYCKGQRMEKLGFKLPKCERKYFIINISIFSTNIIQHPSNSSIPGYDLQVFLY